MNRSAAFADVSDSADSSTTTVAQRDETRWSIRGLGSTTGHYALVHTPVHASWLNQIEIYFSIVQRKVVTPNDFTSLRGLEERLLAFQARYEQTAKPFQWTFTRADLADLLTKLKAKELDRVA